MKWKCKDPKDIVRADQSPVKVCEQYVMRVNILVNGGGFENLLLKIKYYC